MQRVENIWPILRVNDMNASRRFYIDILGFTEADWGNELFTALYHNDAGIYLCCGYQGNPGTWIWVGFDGDIYALQEHLQQHGVTIRMPPRNFSYALEMHIEDPDGHVLRIGTEPDPDKPFETWN